MNTQKIEQIIATIKHHVAAAEAAAQGNNPAGLDAAGYEISGLGDMLRDEVV